MGERVADALSMREVLEEMPGALGGVTSCRKILINWIRDPIVVRQLANHGQLEVATRVEVQMSRDLPDKCGRQVLESGEGAKLGRGEGGMNVIVSLNQFQSCVCNPTNNI